MASHYFYLTFKKLSHPLVLALTKQNTILYNVQNNLELFLITSEYKQDKCALLKSMYLYYFLFITEHFVYTFNMTSNLSIN